MRNVLLTGGTGYIGDLIAQVLLSEPDVSLTLPVRPHHDCDDFRDFVASQANVDPARVNVLHVGEYGADFRQALRAAKIDTIVHCAASVSYFDTEALQASNVALTKVWLDIADNLDVSKFIYISTAFSAGLQKDTIREAPLVEPPSDLVDYTKTKRQAENLVAARGRNFLVVRPSVVIGESVSGLYTGKPFGLYQFFTIAERFMDKRRPFKAIHLVAPNSRCHFLHQDSFQSAFRASFNGQFQGFFNLVSPEDQLPTCREIVLDWLTRFYSRETIHLYESWAEVPADAAKAEPRLQLFTEMVAANLDIVSSPFKFEADTLETMRAGGTKFNCTRRESVNRCIDRFINESDRLKNWSHDGGPAPSS